MNINEAGSRLEQYFANANNNGQQEVFIVTGLMAGSAIISLIFNGIRLYRLCKQMKAEKDVQNQNPQGEAIQMACRSPRLLHKRLVSRMVRKQLGEENYAKYGRQVEAAVFEAGANSTPAELQALFDNTDKGEDGVYEC